jgi:N-methylhydantoinase B
MPSRGLDTPSQSGSAFPVGIDPVRFEVLRNALLAITEEMGATLRRAAYSTNIKTRGDFSCAFFDRELRTIAQAFAQPSHLGSLAHIVPRAIQAYGAEHLQPGDGILMNDPYLGGVHLNDITLMTPVFYRDALVGYVANIAHHVDVGGGAPGSIGVSSEIYQEGLVIPPVRFVKAGEIDRDLFAMIRSNFRGTREISGDFRAQTAANRLGVQRLEALFERAMAQRSCSVTWRRCWTIPSDARQQPLPSSRTAVLRPSRTWTAMECAMSPSSWWRRSTSTRVAFTLI